MARTFELAFDPRELPPTAPKTKEAKDLAGRMEEAQVLRWAAQVCEKPKPTEASAAEKKDGETAKNLEKLVA